MKIVYISSLACSSCLIMRPIIDKLKEILKVEFIQCDYDFDDVSKYDIKNKLPVLIVFNKDKEILRIIGEHKLDEILARLGEINLDEKNI